MKSAEGIFLRLLVAFVIAGVAYVYFGSVLPRPAAVVVALLIAVIELFGPMLGGQGGLSLRALAKLGMAVLVWPGIAWAIIWSGYVADPDARVALAAAAASGLGVFAAGHGQSREHQRLLAVIVSLALPAYAITLSLFDPSPLGVAAACLAVGVGAATAKIALVWPQTHEDLMLVGSCLAFGGAGALLVVAML